VRLCFSEGAWRDYQHWVRTDRAVLAKVNDLIEDVRRRPFSGLGKPEPLKDELAGWWSRRITGEHRLVYRLQGKAGVDQRIEIATCRYHYGTR
jgi:toxin YoeB